LNGGLSSLCLARLGSGGGMLRKNSLKRGSIVEQEDHNAERNYEKDKLF
jgi:hypothetical protein